MTLPARVLLASTTHAPANYRIALKYVGRTSLMKCAHKQESIREGCGKQTTSLVAVLGDDSTTEIHSSKRCTLYRNTDAIDTLVIMHNESIQQLQGLAIVYYLCYTLLVVFCAGLLSEVSTAVESKGRGTFKQMLFPDWDTSP